MHLRIGSNFHRLCVPSFSRCASISNVIYLDSFPSLRLKCTDVPYPSAAPAPIVAPAPSSLLAPAPAPSALHLKTAG